MIDSQEIFALNPEREKKRVINIKRKSDKHENKERNCFAKVLSISTFFGAFFAKCECCYSEDYEELHLARSFPSSSSFSPPSQLVEEISVPSP